MLPATIEPPFPADAFHINSTNAAGCLIYSNTEVYTNQSATLPSHNTLLDLVEFRKEKNITTDDFVIDGIVNFGILVGFDENINLYGSGGSLMNVVNQTTNAYGIVVGSISGTGSSISYTGTMNIDNSVHCNISSSADAYGVYFYSINADSAQTINGVFTISSSSNSSNAYACGVYFNSTAADSTQTINGVFTISSSNSSNAYAYGVQFYSTVSGDITVNGVFTISSSSDSSNAFAHGVSFSSIVSGDITVNGTFTISSYSSNSLNADAYGVYFYSITVNADSTQTINGVFTISSSGSVHGVHFQLSASSCDTTINGVFTLSALTVTGVYFLPTMSGKTTINGVFTISASSTTTSVYAIGVGFLSTVSGDITINGVFTISSSSSSSSSASASGVYFERTPSGKLSGVPKFCSNKIDSGD
ncbi:hypothetical protein FACS1894166_00850 [Bacilli bacterium]|nr:hypothetical protein FACS1894166_00850 [Bacilli bacterium]